MLQLLIGSVAFNHNLITHTLDTRQFTDLLGCVELIDQQLGRAPQGHNSVLSGSSYIFPLVFGIERAGRLLFDFLIVTSHPIRSRGRLRSGRRRDSECRGQN